MVLNAISSKIAHHLCNKLNIDEDQVPVYAYGLELLLAAVISILSMIMASFVLNVPTAWLFFLLAFIPLRVTAGGYHANSHLGCTIVCVVAFILAILVAHIMSQVSSALLYVIPCVMNLMTVLLYAPVEAMQKPLADSEKHINRKRALRISAFFLIISLLVFGVGIKFELSLFFFGVFAASVSQIAGKIQTNSERGKTYG